ncbi:hypothetical protein DSLPV1_046 [Dishui lake phycodnavirus 1]|uniref:hypothetical protein n=1 Tax=Dishui lake phycodnavirus 1 TaxID=2079134 RepID=UPI000CD6A6C5|nr:hypothetical protein C5Y57_gp046 [Dishui lake phycodnavirus 1]AUT19017.1 hypothetical protein DSLPV1_046 [Dishui lake phycodnavirus 1]
MYLLMFTADLPSMYHTSANTRPNFSRLSRSLHLSSSHAFFVSLDFSTKSLSTFFANSPNFFSMGSFVFDSGVSIPNSRTRCFVSVSNPKSNTTSIVSPSTTRSTLFTL